MQRRTMGLGMALAGVLLAAGLAGGCSDAPSENGVGTLSLPLVNNGASGTTYRLRDATFEITSNGYYSYGAGGAPDATSVLVSSEDNPNASAISVSLERGSYNVTLRPGWRLEKQVGAGYEPVDATLLSAAAQWVYVCPHASTTAEYQFGIGGRAIWFNGDLNIQIHVYENPSEYYGGAGATGVAGAGPDSAGGAFD